MLFTEPIFIVFFAIVLTAHWSIDSPRRRKQLLLVASYVFYAGWDPRFLGLILASTLVDYHAALRIAAATTQRVRRAWLMTSLAFCAPATPS